MVAGRRAPGALRWLEWGMATPQPRSLVRDAQQRMLFTGSRIRVTARSDVRGRVIELLDETHVRVRLDMEGVELRLPSRAVLVLKQ